MDNSTSLYLLVNIKGDILSLRSIIPSKPEKLLIICICMALIFQAIAGSLSFNNTVYERNYPSKSITVAQPYTEERLQESRTRSSVEDYLSLYGEIGHGQNVGYHNSVTSADVDNDGVTEVIFCNDDGYFHVLQYLDGDYVDEWKSPNLDWEPYGLTVGDTDSDGTLEIVIGNHYGMLYIFGYQGPGIGYIKEWEYQLGKEEPYGLAVGNVDDDEYNEIIVGALQLLSTDENVFVFGYDGSTYVEEWRFLMTDVLNYAHAVVIYDIDSDGDNEFIVGTEEFKLSTQTTRGTFYIFGHNGNNYVLEYKRPDISDWVGDLACGDVDDDGIPEIVVSGASVNIYQYNMGTYTIEDTISEEHPKLELGDVNGDGQIEIVTAYWEIKVWQVTNLLWESEPFSEEVYSIAIADSDYDSKNEILYTKGVIDWYSDLFIMEYNDVSYIIDWQSHYLPSISSICINDVNTDGRPDLILGTRPGDLIIYESPSTSLEVLEAKHISLGFEIIHVFSGNFDGDTTNDIVATDSRNMIYFLEFDGLIYEKVDEIELVNDNIFVATVEDVDEDGRNELVMGSVNGILTIIGFDGTYGIEWSELITENGITAITTGDSDNDGNLEIIVGGFDYFLYFLVYDGSKYTQIRAQQMAGMIFTLGVGDTDYDSKNELVVEVGYFELIVLKWNGTYYVVDWNMPFSEDAHNEAMQVNYIDTKERDLIAIGTYELFVIGYSTDYMLLFESQTFTFVVQSLIMGDLDESGTNEILISTGAYVSIYGMQKSVIASLSASKTTVQIDEQIVLDGSKSKGEEPLEYFFDFGDGTTSGWIPYKTVSHGFSSPGTYTTSLKIRDSLLKESKNPAEVIITVLSLNTPPVATIEYISPNPATEGESVKFSGSGNDDDGYISAFQWESSIDGKLSTVDTFSTTSLSLGNHAISFRVQDDKGEWSSTVYSTLEVQPKIENLIPVAYIDTISPNPAFEGDAITFTGHGKDDDGTIVSYLWISNLDGELSPLSTFSVSSLSTGTHVISFSVQDDNQAWSKPVTTNLIIDFTALNKKPKAKIESISPNPAFEGELITFVGTGNDEDGEIKSYSWESDIDGKLGSKSTINTSILSKGDHTITFKVQDDDDSWSEPVKMTLSIKEREKKEESWFFYPLLGVIILAFITILILALVYGRKRNKEKVARNFCASCKVAITVTLSQRPLAVICPHCGAYNVIN